MVKFKMIGRDTNAAPVQYRTWVVDDQPDFTGSQYSGLKSGDTSLLDIKAYLIPEDTIADFNLPNPLSWDTTNKVLPSPIASSQLAIIKGFIYLFGGKISGKIYRASLDNPATWEDTQAQLPVPLYGSQLVIIGDFIYLLGGNDSLNPTDHIFGAHVDDPLTWFDLGSKLPVPLQNSQAIIANNNIYLLGGKSTLNTITNVFSASVTDPLNWTDNGSVLPSAVHSSQTAIIDGYAYLFGGTDTFNNPTKNILSAPLSNLSHWIVSGFLPCPATTGQFFTLGTKGYLVTPGDVQFSPKAVGTRIFRCPLSNPNQWIDTRKTIPGEISESQLGVVYDRIFLFGGNGNSAIFACDPKYKYLLTKPDVIVYGYTTRTEVDNVPSTLGLFEVLGFPPWKTDYAS